VTAFRQGFVCTLPNIPGVDLATCQRPLSLDQHATTYNVSLDYKLSPDALLYVTTRRGYNGGGFNSGIPDPALARYNPEYITDYETGIKTDWYLGSMPVRTNVAAFYAKYEDIIRTTTVIRNNFANTGSFNAAKATIYGAQLELQAKPSDKLTLDASYGYLHTKYDSFDNPLLGNLAGNQFAQAPEQTFNGSVTYTQPLPSGELVGIANYAYISEITFSDANVGFPYSFQKGYGLLDLRLELRDIAQLGLDVGIYAKNVTDELYALGITDQTANFGFSSYTYGEPRTYGVELRYRFD
jgi:iron complex outermembrane receptor protein